MADKQKQDEPSIEEILDSIRQIISDEDETAEHSPLEADDDAEPRAGHIVAGAEEDDILELTEKVEEFSPAAPVESPAPAPPPATQPEIEIDMIEGGRGPELPAPETFTAPEKQEEPERVYTKPTVGETAMDDDTILTDSAEGAAYDGFAKLAKKTSIEAGGITLEDIVRSELKPLLRGWLDKNLPGIIDRLVREELEKISKRALDE